jgi:hypothetical protein
MLPAQSMMTSAKRQTASGVDFGRLDRAFIIWSNRGTDAARQKLRGCPSRMDVNKSPTIWANSKERKMSLFPRISRLLCVAGALSTAATIGLTGIATLAPIAIGPAYAACDGMEMGPNGNFEFNPTLCHNGPNGEVSKWTAIAVSDSNLAYGASWQASSRREAEQKALAECSIYASDCKVQMWAQGKCVALATSGSDLTWGTDSGLYPGTAQARALAQCRKLGGDACAIVTHPCSQDLS